MDEKSLQEELIRYQRALEEEWKVENPEGNLTAEQAADLTRKALVKEAPNMIAVIVHLAKHADSESVRASCAKFTVQMLTSDKGIVDPPSALEKLLAESSNRQ